MPKPGNKFTTSNSIQIKINNKRSRFSAKWHHLPSGCVAALTVLVELSVVGCQLSRLFLRQPARGIAINNPNSPPNSFLLLKQLKPLLEPCKRPKSRGAIAWSITWSTTTATSKVLTPSQKSCEATSRPTKLKLKTSPRELES